MNMSAPAPQGGPGLPELVDGVGQGLSSFADAISKLKGAPPEIVDRVQGLLSEFQSIVEEMSSGGAPKAPPAGAPAAMNMGGNPKAAPVV